jgi:hypothetical protein
MTKEDPLVLHIGYADDPERTRRATFPSRIRTIEERLGVLRALGNGLARTGKFGPAKQLLAFHRAAAEKEIAGLRRRMLGTPRRSSKVGDPPAAYQAAVAAVRHRIGREGRLTKLAIANEMGYITVPTLNTYIKDHGLVWPPPKPSR